MTVLGAAPALAQTGTVTGQVISERSGDPVGGAQVIVVGTEIGALTGPDGRFRIGRVGEGEREVQVRSIGFRSVTQTVQVVADGEVTADFAVARSAVELDEVVVTGQVGTSARREIGTSIASIDAAALETAPVTSVTQLLQSRVPGLSILSGGGNPGQGSTILLRGAASMTQDVQPIIYVDGVRIDNSSFQGFGGGGQAWSGIDDIPPGDIERIEVIRGAAAATIYGTEASAGVIQIFTRQGRGEAQTWNLSSEFGASSVPREHYDISIYGSWFYDTYVGTGRQQSQRLSVRGMVDGFSYNVSGSFSDESGVLPNGGVDNGAFRANMRFNPSEAVAINVNTGYSRRRVQQPQQTQQFGYGFNGLAGGPGGVSFPTEFADAFDTQQRSSRFTAGARVEWTPSESFSHRLTFGADAVNMDNTDLTPFGSPMFNRKWHYRRAATNLNFDYGGSFHAELSPRVASRTSAGFQAYSRDVNWLRVSGFAIPGPVTTLDAFGVRTPSDFAEETRSAGFYAEQQFGLDELLYATVGARADGHSAFGEDFAYQIYPKADVSYVISDHDFWPRDLATLRLRGAYGAAGQQPNTFAAVRTWSGGAVLDGRPGFWPSNVGNPDLGPEVGREIEAGFDAGLLAERLNLELTFYDQQTRQAIYNVIRPPSEGFLATQQANVGLVSNSGLEVGLNALVVETPMFRWNVRGNVSTNRNEVVDLGGAPTSTIAALQEIREGYPIGAFFGDRHIERNGEVGLASELLADADGNLPEGWDFIGTPLPTRTVNLGTDVTLGNDLSMSLLVDHRGGHFLHSSTTRLMTPRSVPVAEEDRDEDELFPGGTRIANWCQNPESARMQAMCDAEPGQALGNHVHSADSWRLREVSLSYRIPFSVINRLPLNTARITLSGRNLLRWQDYLGTEAEASSVTAARARQTAFDTPLPRQFIARFDVQF